MDKENHNVSYILDTDHPDFTSVVLRVFTEDLAIERDELVLHYRATGELAEGYYGKLEGDKDYICYLLHRPKAQDRFANTKESV